MITYFVHLDNNYVVSADSDKQDDLKLIGEFKFYDHNDLMEMLNMMQDTVDATLRALNDRVSIMQTKNNKGMN